MQFTSLVKIRDEGRVSQNLLGRLNHTDPATIMGIVNRLVQRQFIQKTTDPIDKRKSVLTLTTKGLELIEACWLFDARPEQVEVVVHPQSVVHSLVDYVDGSVLAQLGNPDMRTPIASALAWPEEWSTLLIWGLLGSVILFFSNRQSKI